MQPTQQGESFRAALQDHGSRTTEILTDFILPDEPERADLLLIRRGDARADTEARTLRGLWQFVTRVALVEFKPPNRPAQAGDLAKLLGHGAALHHLRWREIGAFQDLLLCLVVTTVTAALRQEIEELRSTGATLSLPAPGYTLADTRPYRILIVDLSVVVQAEDDEWMSIFVPSAPLSEDARRWATERMPSPHTPEDEKLEGHDEVLARLLRATPPEDILRAAGVDRLLGSLSPEQRLADLSPEQRLLAMPVSALRVLPEEYLRTLPDEVRAAIRERITQDR